MERKDLYICNSVYQILVSLWIKHTLNAEIPSDLIISNHMNNGSALVERIRSEKYFDHVYFVETFDYTRYRTPSSRKERYYEELFPQKVLEQYWTGLDVYSTLYIANPDRFAQLTFNVLIRNNPDLHAVIFEDGMLTYSPMFRSDIESSQIKSDNAIKLFVYKYIFRHKAICENIREMLLFHPKDIDWTPTFKISELPKINCDDVLFKNMCNRVFQYDSESDRYDRKYLFMEESFAAEGVPINDVQLLEQLAQRVGKDNIMVKIHPRNPENRFAQHGFLTNRNTSIPWELIVMNLEDFSGMTLITVASSSVLNPMMIFGKKIKAYSLFNLVDKSANKSRLLTGPFWNTVHKMFIQNADIITICDSIDEIK